MLLESFISVYIWKEIARLSSCISKLSYLTGFLRLYLCPILIWTDFCFSSTGREEEQKSKGATENFSFYGVVNLSLACKRKNTHNMTIHMRTWRFLFEFFFDKKKSLLCHGALEEMNISEHGDAITIIIQIYICVIFSHKYWQTHKRHLRSYKWNMPFIEFHSKPNLKTTVFMICFT